MKLVGNKTRVVDREEHGVLRNGGLDIAKLAAS
jgi:hypothetical protein